MRMWWVALALSAGCARTVPPVPAAEETPVVEAAPEQAEVSREALVADLEQAYRELQASHYDLYAHASQDEYDALLQRLVTEARPGSRREATAVLTELVAFGHVGHARVDFPVAEYIGFLQAGGRIFPADIEVREGQVVVAHSYTDALQPGEVIEVFDGQPVDAVLDDLGRWVSAEWDYLRDAQLERYFPRVLWLAYGEREAFEVKVRGEDAPRRIEAVLGIEVEPEKAEWEAALQDRHGETMGDVAYLRPGPFFATGGDDTEQSYLAWLDQAMAGFVEAGVTDLLVDLRNNPGGDNSFSDPMIAWFADEPFRFASRYSVKSSEHTLSVLYQLAPDSDLMASMARAMADVPPGESFDFEIPLVQPRDTRFEGRVWVLVDRHSYSNATSVAAIVQDMGFATVMGEQTADLPSSYASSAKFTLERTGLGVTYPKGYFVRPSGVEGVAGVVPDVPLPRTDTPEQGLEQALAHIRAH